MKVIGAGFGRTGTTSLQAALEQLGFGSCYHMTEVFKNPEHADVWLAAWRGEPVDWNGFLGDYESAVDWPACAFYRELMERYPDAKVLLSVRDPERWYESTRSTIYELSAVLPRSPIARAILALIFLAVFGAPVKRRMSDEIIWEGTFDGRFEDRTYATQIFEQHNEEVKRRVPQDRLLVYEVKEGWGPLCEFLGVPEPDEPFPRLNDAARMRRGIRTVRALSFAAALLPLAAAVVLILRRIRSA